MHPKNMVVHFFDSFFSHSWFSFCPAYKAMDDMVSDKGNGEDPNFHEATIFCVGVCKFW